MAERKTKREENFIELDQEETNIILEPAKIEVGSGYALSVRYDENEKPIVDIKTYGKVDLEKLRKEIKKTFPNARINQLNQTHHSVTIAKKEKKKRKK
jgi:hypothetical protein